eukprot:13810809-Alexandrium_andersonii.AAC.1
MGGTGSGGLEGSSGGAGAKSTSRLPGGPPASARTPCRRSAGPARRPVPSRRTQSHVLTPNAGKRGRTRTFPRVARRPCGLQQA